MVQEIYIIDDTTKTIDKIKEIFKEEENEYKFSNITTSEIEIALRNIPSLIIINEDNVTKDIIELCNMIRANEDNSITPIIVESSNPTKEHIFEVMKTSVEYYVLKPVDDQYLYYIVKNLMRLMYVNRRVSPLTGLPGNVQIHAEMKKRVLNREEFAVLYFDLDNFKAYNDVYGFLKGDEIIKFTARTIVRNIHNLKDNDSFVGHIGGDDFVAIVSKTNYEAVCQNIIAEFDQEVLQYYTKEDAEKGYIEVINRRGILEEFPLTSISIGVVEVDPGRFDNILEIGEVGAQVKHNAKTVMGSTYVINRRKISVK
ncbi:MAG TPA: diguanylate cyclase [Candidatus Merdicola faecigallinarum]|uniref:Stage 0 sporulation protein A homolog n=1 Tax=Candidatus Merdicola faecigallinarum TaxID=2840862 RepID=A0A9D1M0J9_9FIRM|nr:diguanylate cyclase [Candidatus Merdicola faecigallinarum]